MKDTFIFFPPSLLPPRCRPFATLGGRLHVASRASRRAAADAEPRCKNRFFRCRHSPASAKPGRNAPLRSDARKPSPASRFALAERPADTSLPTKTSGPADTPSCVAGNRTLPAILAGSAGVRGHSRPARSVGPSSRRMKAPHYKFNFLKRRRNEHSSSTSDGSASTSTRSCSIESRWRTVTVPSASVWPSTVMQNGVPIAS